MGDLDRAYRRLRLEEAYLHAYGSGLALIVANLLAPVRAVTPLAIMSRLARSPVRPGWTALAGDGVRLFDP